VINAVNKQKQSLGRLGSSHLLKKAQQLVDRVFLRERCIETKNINRSSKSEMMIAELSVF